MTSTGPTPSTPEVRRVSFRSRAIALPTLLSFAIAGVFIFFLLARFDINVGDAWRMAKGADPGLLAAAFVLYYLTFPFRGYRWRLLLDNAGAFEEATGRPSLAQSSELILISSFTNSVTWFRLGDAYRAFLVSDRWRVSFPRVIGTVVAERVLDLGVVFVLLLVAGIGLLRGDTASTAGAVLVGATALAGVAGLALLVMRLFGLRAVRFLPARLQNAYARFQEGTLGSFRRLPVLIVISAAIWLLEAARLYFVIQALDLDVSLSLILFAALAHSLLTTIPLTPGGVGFVEAGLTGLLALGLGRADAVGVTLLDRSITYLSILATGGLTFAVRQTIGMQRRGAQGVTEQPPERA